MIHSHIEKKINDINSHDCSDVHFLLLSLKISPVKEIITTYHQTPHHPAQTTIDHVALQKKNVMRWKFCCNMRWIWFTTSIFHRVSVFASENVERSVYKQSILWWSLSNELLQDRRSICGALQHHHHHQAASVQIHTRLMLDDTQGMYLTSIERVSSTTSSLIFMCRVPLTDASFSQLHGWAPPCRLFRTDDFVR